MYIYINNCPVINHPANKKFGLVCVYFFGGLKGVRLALRCWAGCISGICRPFSSM